MVIMVMVVMFAIPFVLSEKNQHHLKNINVSADFQRDFVGLLPIFVLRPVCVNCNQEAMQALRKLSLNKLRCGSKRKTALAPNGSCSSQTGCESVRKLEEWTGS